MKSFYLIIVMLLTGSKLVLGQTLTEILSRPTDSSVTISVLFDQYAQEDVYWEYGTSTGAYTAKTSTYTTALDTSPLIANITGLMPNTKYFYWTRYRTNGSSSSFLAGTEHSFHTARPVGSTFTFAVEADPHMDSNTTPAAYALTLQNILSKDPDFLIDLGDNFMSEKLAVPSQTNITNRVRLLTTYYGMACHSVPLYLVIGNHEGELGWLLNGTANNLAVMAANTRLQYYANPLPNAFYSGNTVSENYVGLRQNYYSWEWGNALFVVLDIYWYTKTKPDWGWTLGVDQYNWFEKVIKTSKAKFKFVFCHQLIGGNGVDGRGGIEYADFFEMGGENQDSTWGFNTYRPGWDDPIHTLMKNNNGTIYFHGHDHCYAKQDKDGIVYQEVPQPSATNITNITGIQYGYVSGVLMPSRGYLLVTVSDTSTKVDYIKTYLPNEVKGSNTNGEVAYSYTINSSALSVKQDNDLPTTFQLKQNYPNPFSTETSINYKISSANKIQLKVYDIFGREITTLVNQYQQPGDYTVSFNSQELSIPSGIYYYKMTIGNDSRTMKMICIK